jgi:hypothetical protein
VGEYDEDQWGEVHEEVLANLAAAREERLATESDIAKLEELDRMVKGKSRGTRAPAERKGPVDELAFLKSVTEGEQRTGGSSRAAHFQPAQRDEEPPHGALDGVLGDNGGADAPKTLKCAECGTMNGTTEWYCAQCGAELAAL